ncbi:valine--tRNA ligase [Spiroplasma turonicum]|uniref:Valine--tRNA ligase n=1 Tax=Spiroplasma turonicum TaxID=216946 RepID=A0A0K1P5Y1_9MOLU|nr:valine--tRNA ligase [Spiroplasma turonicum]AKU79711.1 valyl-tRNA synthetase [Spiroplasma turonicum]ALX70729.1 valyl-tRNA synthetase [Spiroplasma turonicum]
MEFKELEKKYNHIKVEKDKYKIWLDLDLFKSQEDSKKTPYSIVIPPPNVTGKLHLGHAWDGSLQDLLIRYKKLSGYDTVWIPGMDHAGIATQAKVEERLRKDNISRHDLGREKFINKVWEWKEEYSLNIRNQWSKLGLALDYSKEKFTYSKELNKIVNYVFVEMYKKGLIYRGERIINWDPKQKTALSNIEVIYKETKGKMYYFKYFFKNEDKYLTVATTRPETMFGDVCLVINPNDERYKEYINKTVINPANGKEIPVIADEYVETDFGTGIMKCTPAHDPNDFELSLKHNLELINVMSLDGTMNELTGEFNNIDRFEVRKILIDKLIKNDLVVKIEDIIHQVGYSERSGVIIEPLISKQWFVKMKSLAKNVIDLQKSDNKIKFYPNRFSTTLKTWMNNAYDWTISRQLWWGHQIPAWYNKNNDDIYVGLEEPKDIDNWYRDEDVLDTWFSSAFWPFATMEWTPNKESKLMKRYFPISVMVTGYDIIFFWVARMIFQSLEFTKSKPFNDVLLHGLIRDEKGQKMSKSLGNGVDPMDVIEEYGADSLRYFLITNSSPGQDLRYSDEKLKSTWNFINKLWNASRFVFMNSNIICTDKDYKELYFDNLTNNNLSEKWILNRLTICKQDIKKAIDQYEFSVVGKLLYSFIWDEYCSWYLELSKAQLQNDKLSSTEINNIKATLIYVLKQIILMLHPLCPFVTEEIYSSLGLLKSIMLETYDNEIFNFDDKGIENVFEIISAIREFRLEHNIKNNLQLNFNLNTKNSKLFIKSPELINYLNNVSIKLVNSTISNTLNLVEEITSLSIKDYYLEIKNENFIDKEEALKSLLEAKNKLEAELRRSESIISNDNFMKKASSEKRELELNKYKNYKLQYDSLLKKINNIH